MSIFYKIFGIGGTGIAIVWFGGTASQAAIVNILEQEALQEFQELEDRLDRQSGFTAAQIKGIRNLIIAPAETCTFDKQGRVLIPPTLRAYAALDKDVVFVGGQNNKVELWTSATWDRVCGQAEKDFPTDSPQLADLGI